jgi:transaldolase
MQVFYDGIDIQKYSNHPSVEGFTTNCSFFSQSKIKNYSEFYEKNKSFIQSKDISFQTWKIGDAGIKQIDEIHAIDKNIFVKVPIIDVNGDYNLYLFNHAFVNEIPVNITAIYSFEQINKVLELLQSENYKDTKVIVSIFAGSIADNGNDASPYIKYSKEVFKKYPNVRILWACCRELHNIMYARDLGCDIITASGDMIDKLNAINRDLNVLSLERVRKFYNDATNGDLTIA